MQRGGTSSLESSTVVGGNYQCDQCQFADLNHSTVNKNFEDNSVQLGAFIGNNTIGGNLEIHNGPLRRALLVSALGDPGSRVSTNTKSPARH